MIYNSIMVKTSKNKTYVKESTIPSANKGLFAQIYIKKGDIIAEFKGKLKTPNQPTLNPRSNVNFTDGYHLDCNDDDQASFANDAINMTKERRQLMKALNSQEPIYKIHENAQINATIKLNDDLHRAFLIAKKDINPNEEIFCHYGFPYWFSQEVRNGFLQEDEIDKNGFPETFHKYPAFINYLKLFYPDLIGIGAGVCEDHSDIFIYFEGDSGMCIHVPNYKRIMRRVVIG